MVCHLQQLYYDSTDVICLIMGESQNHKIDVTSMNIGMVKNETKISILHIELLVLVSRLFINLYFPR